MSPLSNGSRADLSPAALRADWRDMDEAIKEAKKAASLAGLNTDASSSDLASQRLASREGSELISFALELQGLSSAAAARDVEKALECIDGVRASLIYTNSIAWITAPTSIPPETIIEKLANMGVRAELTEGSLRRRADRLIAPPVHHAQRHPHRSSLLERIKGTKQALTEANPENRHLGLTLERNDNADVLFTARGLVTIDRLLVSLVLTIPILVFSYVPSLQIDYWQWISFALSIPVVTWGAWPFHRAALGGLRRKMSALDAASAAAILAAFGWSMIMLFFTPAGSIGWTSEPRWFAYDYPSILDGELFLDVACGMTVLLLGGRIAMRHSRSNLVEDARREHEGTMYEVTVVRKAGPRAAAVKQVVPVQELRVGDDILVPTGGVIPCDGHVVGGASTVASGLLRSAVDHDEGHQDARTVKVNSKVYAGSTNLGGPLKIRVRHSGSATRLAAMLRWIDESTAVQNRSAQLATRSASLLVPWAVTIAIVDFCMWLLIRGNYNVAFATALAILACVAPVSLAISAPLATRYGIESGARKGLLIRNSETIRVMERVNTVIFNRVGTLTKDTMSVETVIASDRENPELVLRVAAALSMESDHPVSKALVKAAREARDRGAGGEEIPHWIDVSQAHVDEHGTFTGLVEIPIEVARGKTEMRQVEASLWRPRDESDLEGRLALAISAGGTPLVVNWKGKPRGVITMHSDPKDDAMDAIDELETMDIETVMLTRDAYPVARRLANFMGISKVLAGIAPAKKTVTVRSVHTRGNVVGMVGDESVRGPLNVADVGLLVQPGDNFDVPEADVVILRQDVSAIPEAFTLARRVGALVDRNLMFAWVYNITAMLLAAAGLLHPMAATVLMLTSSFITEWSSQQARRF
ncbi:cation-translocating P-type ATPase [Corynebacterium sp. 11A]|uniref:heavy metal translocating P-type ATPase n=1 Tax=Corynebacterium sp. 11A TaxID=2080510 RepID=UPI00124F18E6|nr:HAD family hydrolase [Corynebacterium sp. 11A]